MSTEISGLCQHLIEQIEDYAILLLDENGYIVTWNKGAEKIKGYLADEIIGQHFSVFYSDEDVKNGLPEQLLGKARESGKAITEGWRKRRDGSYFWGSMIINSVRNNDGEITGFSKITRDLTEKRQHEQQIEQFTKDLEIKVEKRTRELQQAEARYRHMFMNNPLPMWIIDVQTFQFLEVNEVAVAAYGYSRGEFLSMTALDIRPEEDKTIFKEVIHPLKIDADSYYRGVWRHMRKDGTIIEVEVFAHDIEFDGRNARLILSQDITQRRIAEKKLANRVKYFRALLENNYDAIILHNESGEVSYQSPATERVIGYSLEGLQQTNLISIFHKEDTEEVLKRLEEAINTPGRPVWLICRVRHKDGYYIWLEGTLTNLMHDDAIGAIVSNFRDVTDRKVSAEQLMKSKREVEKVYREQVLMSERLSSIFNALPANIALINKQGFIVAVNDSWRRYSEDNGFIGSTYGIDDNYIGIAETAPGVEPADGKRIAQAIRDITAGKLPGFSMEYQWSNEKTLRWVKVIIAKEHYGESGIVLMHMDVTDRVLAEQETRRQKVQLERLLRGMGDAFVTLDGSWRYTFANEHALALMSKKWHQLEGKVMWDVFPDIKGTDFEKQYTDVLTYGRESAFEIYYASYEMWLDVRAYPHEGGVAIFYTDITARKIAEKKLYESEHKFRALIENSADFVVLYSRELTLTYCSSSVEKAFNVDMSAILGTPMYDNIFPGDLPLAEDAVARALAKPGEPVYFTLRKQFGSEQVFYFEGTLINLLNDSIVAAIVCNYRDVTQRRLAEQQLEATYRDVERLLLHTDEAFIILDVDLKIATFNENARLLANRYLKNELVKGEHIFTVVDASRPDDANKLYSDVLAGQKRETEIFFVTEDDRVIYFLNLMRPIYDDKGSVEGIFMTIRDISEKKAVQRKIEFDRNNLAALINNTNDLIWSIDKNRKLITSNKAFDETVMVLSGNPVNKGETIGAGFSDTELVKWSKMYDKAFAGNTFNTVEHSIEPADRWVETSFHPIWSLDEIVGVACYSRDITERIQSEKKILNANRLYAFISAINQTIVHATSRQEVFRKACRIAVETGKFKIAWVGLIDEDARTIVLEEEAGMSDKERRIFSRVDFDENGPTDRVLKTGSNYFNNDLLADTSMVRWHGVARAAGVRSLMALPIKNKEKVIGVFSLYAEEQNLFDSNEVAMLEEVAGDISFSLEVFDKEEQRRHAVSKLLENEAMLNEAQEIAHLGSWEIDLVTGKQIWSQEAKRIIGVERDSEEQTIFDQYMQAIHPDDKVVVLDIMNDLGISDDNFFCNYRIVRPDGEIRHIYSESKREKNDEGMPVRLHGILHDVTSARLAEDALAQSEENLRLIMDLIPQCIYARDANGRFLFVNKRFADLAGLSPNQLISNAIIDNDIHEQTRNILAYGDDSVLATGVQEILPELEFVSTTGGDAKTFYVVKVPYKLPGSKDSAVLGIALDITERKAAEAERTKMIADIVQRNKDLEQFSYIVSHNLRAPVANIIGISEIMQFEGVDDEEKNDMLGELAVSIQKLDSVIKDLNYILQVKQEYSENRDLVKFDDLVNDIKQSIRNVVENEHVTVVSNFLEVSEMHTLKSYMFSIFYNLLSNSIKYRRPDVPVFVEITTKRIQDNRFTITFKDNGLGIDLERRGDQIFGLYKRFHTHTEGKGVGLYMVKTQVETLGGSITVASKVNEGTEFKIEMEIC